MPHEAAATRRVEEDQLLSPLPLQQYKMQRRDAPVVSLSLSLSLSLSMSCGFIMDPIKETAVALKFSL